MPELPEVEIVKEKLKPLVNKTASYFWNNWPRGLKVAKNAEYVSRDIAERRVIKVWRQGKALLIGLSSKNGKKADIERILAFHLRMSGRLGFNNEDLKHIHATVGFTDGSKLYFNDPRKFGVIWYSAPEEVMKENYFSKLGPDARGIKFKYFEERLREHRGMIKPLLLRQDFVAGIGNIVADETLWEAKIHPKKLIEGLNPANIKRLYLALQKVLERGIKSGGATLRDWKNPNGKSGNFQKYVKVYGRKGEACPRCDDRIERITAAGRGTWICPKCQKLK